MKCITCGTELAEGALLCPHCGRVVDAEDVARQKAAAGQLTRKEFYKLPGMKSCRSNILVCAIVLYICGGATLLVSILLADEFLASILDGVLLVALGLWLQLGKSRVCAIIILAYSIFNMVIAMLSTGRLQGWWILLAGIWAVTYTFKFHKLWNQYQKEGTLPQEALKKD